MSEKRKVVPSNCPVPKLPLTIAQIEARYPSWVDQLNARLEALCRSCRAESSTAPTAGRTSSDEFLVRFDASNAGR